jgi:hypothetical protein
MILKEYDCSEIIVIHDNFIYLNGGFTGTRKLLSPYRRMLDAVVLY